MEYGMLEREDRRREDRRREDKSKAVEVKQEVESAY